MYNSCVSRSYHAKSAYNDRSNSGSVFVLFLSCFFVVQSVSIEFVRTSFNYPNQKQELLISYVMLVRSWSTGQVYTSKRMGGGSGALLTEAMRYHHQGIRGLANVMIFKDADPTIIGLLDHQLKPHSLEVSCIVVSQIWLVWLRCRKSLAFAWRAWCWICNGRPFTLYHCHLILFSCKNVS